VTGLADSVVARLVKQRDVVAAVHEHSRSLSVRVTSRDGHVSLTVDAFGAMTGLSLGPSAYTLGPNALSELIVSTARVGAALIVERQNFLAKQLATRLEEIRHTSLTGDDDGQAGEIDAR
jgi:hypothetical protein